MKLKIFLSASFPCWNLGCIKETPLNRNYGIDFDGVHI